MRRLRQHFRLGQPLTLWQTSSGRRQPRCLAFRQPCMAPPQLLHLIREERRAWTLAKAAPVVMMLALRDSPWGQPWNPARDIGPKVLVLRAKCLLERWFFVHQDEDVEKEPEQRGIPEEAPIAE
jgi:hypothetical protein